MRIGARLGDSSEGRRTSREPWSQRCRGTSESSRCRGSRVQRLAPARPMRRGALARGLACTQQIALQPQSPLRSVDLTSRRFKASPTTAPPPFRRAAGAGMIPLIPRAVRVWVRGVVEARRATGGRAQTAQIAVCCGTGRSWQRRVLVTVDRLHCTRGCSRQGLTQLSIP